MSSHSQVEKIADGEMVYCGDHYCSGHQYYVIKCSCGTALERTKYASREEMEKLHLEHRLEVLEQLGVRYDSVDTVN